MKRAILLICLSAALVMAQRETVLSQQELPRPPAPLVLATGDSVSLAFKLPASPRPQRVQVLRAVKDAGGFIEVANLDASQLSWVDTDVQPGTVYWYTIRTSRGGAQSEPSPRAEAAIAGGSRVTLIGGSTERALFEVVVYRGGRRLAAQFVHKAGDVIGGFAWVEELGRVEDFRLGPRLTSLELAQSDAHQAQREVLTAPGGSPLTDLAGRRIELEFRVPAGRQEVLQATLQDSQGRGQQLTEGESLLIR
jgi:hypothetical protein